ncbi:hypothetical protein CKO44_12825 [Rubrivivax gelatinosus]|uniref:response regulator transcription factor n=1 Tax=Rubrivivax gelatinosus TaxID=28068 RepID=UPI0019073825|nr:response regulator [Rubrivivax gelatinosus]MBK1614351.1 hypothetical protein [Rubrivivax gelatinosus]
MTPRPARTVYLVDDNAEFRSSAQWWLSGAGYRVHDFGDAQAALDALDRLAAERPDELHRACLLLDVRMPGLSGLDLHDRLADRGLTLPTTRWSRRWNAPSRSPSRPGRAARWRRCSRCRRRT